MSVKLFLITVTCLFLVGCSSHGNVKEFGTLELYYPDNITIEEVDKLGNYLTMVNFTKEDKKSLQLLKTDTSYTVKMIVTATVLSNDSILLRLLEFKKELMYSLYPKTQFELHLCDDYFETKKVLK
jgi:uncharacterized protein YcfL